MNTEETPTPAPTPVVLDEITLNDTVGVNLNAHGKSIYEAYLKSHGIESPNKTPDTLKLQLWEMSAIFGPHIGYGKQTPFDTKMKHTGRRGTALRTLERYSDSSIPDAPIRKQSVQDAPAAYHRYTDDDRAVRGIMGADHPISLSIEPVRGDYMHSRRIAKMTIDIGSFRREIRADFGGGFQSSSLHEAISSLVNSAYGSLRGRATVSSGEWSSYDFMSPYPGESYDEMYRGPMVGMDQDESQTTAAVQPPIDRIRAIEALIMAEEIAASAASSLNESLGEIAYAPQPPTTAEMPAPF